MAKKKPKQVVQKEEQMTVDDLSVGDVIPDLHDIDVEITDDLIEQMRKFEQEGKTHAIYRKKITGSFLFWRMNKDKPKKKKKPKKTEEIEIEEFVEEITEDEELEETLGELEEETKLDEMIEEEVESEEDLMLDAIEDYKTEYNVKTVKTNSKKFKEFFKKFKESE